VRALRYYEEQELVVATRSPGGQRHYPDSTVERVLLIQQLYAAGLSSRTIRELLPCVDSGVSTPATHARLVAERDNIDLQIQNLIDTRNKLDDVIVAADCSAAAALA